MGDSKTLVMSSLLLVLVFLVSSTTAEWPSRRPPLVGRRPQLTQIWQNRAYQAPISAPAPIEIDVVNLQHLPCPKGEGYYPYPTNCSKFYRCVDYEGTNTVFSRYAFICPNKTVFLPGKDTCVPGACQLGPIDPSRPPAPSGEINTTLEIATPSTPDGPVEVTVTVPPSVDSWGSSGSSASEGGSSDEGPETASSAALPPAGGTGIPTPPASAGETTGQECHPGRYVQHEKFCNLYHLCDDPKSLNSCPAGSVFDQVRSMCRLSAADEPLCEGKTVALPFFYRYRGERPFHGSSAWLPQEPSPLLPSLYSSTDSKFHRWTPIFVQPIPPAHFLDRMKPQPFTMYL